MVGISDLFHGRTWREPATGPHKYCSCMYTTLCSSRKHTNFAAVSRHELRAGEQSYVNNGRLIHTEVQLKLRHPTVGKLVLLK